MSYRQRTYQVRHSVGPGQETSAIAEQSVALDDQTALVLNWLADGKLSLAVERQGVTKAQVILAAAAGTTFLNTLTAAKPA